MSIALTVNGVVYQYPEETDSNWGTQATNWASAMSSSTLQKNGGSFTLTNEVNLGPTYSFKLPYIKSYNSNPASSGVVRLCAGDSVTWRNAANNADLNLTTVSDQLRFNGSEFVTTAGSQALSNKTYSGTSLVLNGGTPLTTTNRTGTGNLVLATSPTITSPTLVTPVLGAATATTIVASGNITAAGLVAGAGTPLTTTNRTGTGNLVLATSPTITSPSLVTPVLGVATATSINKTVITAPATTATLALANNSSLNTVGAFSVTLTSSGSTNVLLPLTGTLATLAGVEILSNKTLTQTYTTENKSKFIEVNDYLPNTIVYGIIPPTSGTLSSTHPYGIGYVAGVRVVMAATPKTYTASKDTYVDISPAGVYVYSEVNVGAGAPGITSPNMRVAKVTTSAGAVTSVTTLKEKSTSFGLSAGGNITTGYSNVNFGENAGTNITSGYDNANFGENSGQSISSGFSNINFGANSGKLITTGYENINIGPYSGAFIVGGFTNMNIGVESGYKVSSGYNNINIGYKAGVTSVIGNAITTGYENTCIGDLSGFTSATQLNKIVAIGNSAKVSRSNEWCIGTLGTVQQIPEGSNAAMGVATLVAGTIVVSNSKVLANSRIFLTTQSPSGTVGTPYISARSAGVSFTITSTSGSDTSTVAWNIVQPQ